MAELFLAKDTFTQEQVVIKRILPYLSDEEEFVGMFLDEARIAAQLHHPNIIRLHELGKLEDSIFIAMEFVEGVDLRKLVQEEMKVEQVVPAHIAAFVVAQVCAGLQYAHNRSGRDGKPMEIVHRDVSPQNVMVGFNGAVKLVDFGIAKAGAIVERSKPGVIKGKFLYLSPEQLSQDRVDHRSDLFAIGTMLYEVTTGKSPFHKPTTEAVIYAIRAEDPPPPHHVRAHYPRALSQVVMKCLTKDREKRYQQAGEIQRDLEAYIRAEAPTDASTLSRYVAKLLGIDDEDERTVMLDQATVATDGSPREAARGPVQELPRAAPPPPVGRRPTRGEVRAFDIGEEPSTQADRPLALAPLSRKPAPLSAVPRPSSEVGVARPRTASKDPALELGAPQMPPEPKTKPARPSRVPALAEEPPALEVADDDGSSGSGVDEQPGPETDPDRLAGEPLGDASSSVRSTRPDVRRLSRALLKQPLAIGAIAFGTVLLLGLLGIAVVGRHRAPERLPDPAPEKPPEMAAPVQASPEPPRDAPKPSVPDAGAKPSLAPSAVARVTVVFQAPQGTRISAEGSSFSPGVRYQLLPKSYRLLYKCPPARRGKKPVEQNQTVKISANGGVPTVLKLCQPRR